MVFVFINVATSIDHISLTIVVLADMKNLNDDQVKASLKGAEPEEQLLIERDPQADADSKPAGEIKIA